MIPLRTEVRAALDYVETRLRAEERARGAMTPGETKTAAEIHLDAWFALEANQRMADARQPLNRTEEQSVRRGVLDRLFGLGELQPLLEDTAVETIAINSPERVVLHLADGTRRELEPRSPTVPRS